MSHQNMTIGALIRANTERAKAEPLEVARARAIREGKQGQWDYIEAFYAGFKKYVKESVEVGDFPNLLKVSEKDAWTFGVELVRSVEGAVPKSHFGFALWEAAVHWATEQEITLFWVQEHNGGGRNSFWCLGIALLDSAHPKNS